MLLVLLLFCTVSIFDCVSLSLVAACWIFVGRSAAKRECNLVLNCATSTFIPPLTATPRPPSQQPTNRHNQPSTHLSQSLREPAPRRHKPTPFAMSNKCPGECADKNPVPCLCGSSVPVPCAASSAAVGSGSEGSYEDDASARCTS